MVTFHVRNSHSRYQVFPADSILWAEVDNPITIRAKGKKKEISVLLQGGQLKKAPGNDSLFSARVDDTVSMALLTISERLEGGKLKLVYTKPYTIKRIAPPVLYVCGVKTDSVIDKQQLIEDDILYAKSERYKFKLLIRSFDMINVKENSYDTLHSRNNHFSIEQRRQIYRLQPGNMLYFENILCQMPTGEVVKLRSVQLFVDETNKYKVGYRKVGK
jgi:hypothetical protein